MESEAQIQSLNRLSTHNKLIGPNLLEGHFNVEKPGQYFVGSISYIEIQANKRDRVAADKALILRV